MWTRVVKILVFILINTLSFSPFALFSQNLYNTWLRGAIDIPVSPKLNTVIELQHRRQSSMNTSDFVGGNLLTSYRNWVHYSYSPSLKLSVSPFAFFRHNDIIHPTFESTDKTAKEFRFSLAVEMKEKMLNNFYFANRFASEYRILSNRNIDIIRFRNRVGVNYLLSSKVNLSLSNEFILNIHKLNDYPLFNQNRTVLSTELMALQDVKFEIGYIYLHRLINHLPLQFKEHNLFLHLSYSLGKTSL